MTDQDIFDLAKDLDSIGHQQKETIRFIYVEPKGPNDLSDLMFYFSGRKLISMSHKSVYSSFAHWSPEDRTGWAEKTYYGRTLEGPWGAVLEEVQTLKSTFPHVDFIVRESSEHTSYHRMDD
jgi:hypothetical protein